MEKEQAILDDEYKRQLPDFYSALSSLDLNGRKISSPLLIDMEAHNYLKAPIRLIVVGQQTNGWGDDEPGETNRFDVEHLKRHYKEFALGRKYVRSPFWAACHHAYRSLFLDSPDPTFVEEGFVWTNLLKIDESNRCPDGDVLQVLLEHFCLLPIEVDVCKPDAVIFFTGPDYDSILKAQFPTAEFRELPGYSVRALARIESPCLPEASFRTYHPNFLRQQRRGDLVAAMIEQIRKDLRLATTTLPAWT